MSKIYSPEELNSFSKETIVAVILSMPAGTIRRALRQNVRKICCGTASDSFSGGKYHECQVCKRASSVPDQSEIPAERHPHFQAGDGKLDDPVCGLVSGNLL